MSIEETLENVIAGFLSEQIEGMSFETVAAGSSGPDLELLSNMNIDGKAFVSFFGLGFYQIGSRQSFYEKVELCCYYHCKEQDG